MSQYDFNNVCENGNIDLVKQMTSNKNYDWDYGLYYAAKGGHMNIIQFLIEKAYKNNSFFIDCNWGLSGAAKGGHMNIIDFFIEKGANAWNWVLYKVVICILFNFLLKKHRKIMVLLYMIGIEVFIMLQKVVI